MAVPHRGAAQGVPGEMIGAQCGEVIASVPARLPRGHFGRTGRGHLLPNHTRSMSPVC